MNRRSVVDVLFEYINYTSFGFWDFKICIISSIYFI